jgi:hypothetical protein
VCLCFDLQTYYNHTTSGQSISLGYTTINLKSVTYAVATVNATAVHSVTSTLYSSQHLLRLMLKIKVQNYTDFMEVSLPKHLCTQHQSGYLTETKEQTTD